MKAPSTFNDKVLALIEAKRCTWREACQELARRGVVVRANKRRRLKCREARESAMKLI